MSNQHDLVAKLDALVRLVALQLIGDKTATEAIRVLGRSGLDNELIAEIVGTTPGTVRGTLSRARRKGAGRGKSRAERGG